MEPFRALVGDKLLEEQRSYGFVLQTLIIGIGTWIASNLPWFVTQLGVSNEAAAGELPQSVFVSFAIGAAVFMTSILVTVFTTTEDPPASFATESQLGDDADRNSGLGEIVSFVTNMPPVMLKLGVVQFFSWFAFFTMWSFATPALTEAVFAAPIPQDGVADYELKRMAYEQAANAVSSSMGVYGLSSMAFCFAVVGLDRQAQVEQNVDSSGELGHRRHGVHFDVFVVARFCGMVEFQFCMRRHFLGEHSEHALRHVVWCCSRPKNGCRNGVFNMFIVLPQIIAALGGIVWLNNLILEVMSSIPWFWQV